MREPCGNTAAEISRDQQVVLSREDWELRQEERERQLLGRRLFIKTLLSNHLYIVNGNPWFLRDAIANIDDENFWVFCPCPISKDTITDIWADDPEKLAKLFTSGELNKFKSLIQHEVEKLADILDGKL